MYYSNLRPLCHLLLWCSCVAVSAAAPRLRVGVERNAPPLAFLDERGEPTGFTVDLLREMARAGGADIELVPNYWKNLSEDFRAGRLDAFANTIVTDNNSAELDFSIAHARLHAIVFHRADRPLRRTADFPGKVIGTLVGTAALNDALRHNGWGATIRKFESWQAALDATQRGECDATLLTNRPILPGVDDHGLARSFVDDLVYPFHFGVHKGDAAALALLNEALAATLRDGSFDRVWAKWIGPIEPRPIRLADLRPYYVPVGAGLLALAALIWWQRWMLRRLARQAEALRQSEERWKFALEGSGAAVWDWDVPGNRIVYSRNCQELLGFSESEIGPRVEDSLKLCEPEDRPKLEAALDARSRDHAGPFAVEHRMQCKDGTKKWILNRGMVVRRDPLGKPVRLIGTYTDLTPHKQAEENRLVLAKLESTGVLAGGIAHDFNNLLASILLSVDLAQSDPALPHRASECLQLVRKSTLAAHSLTQQLLSFARGGDPVRRPVNLEELVRDALRVTLSGTPVTGKVAVAPGLWSIEVDDSQIAQVIRNLVLNACESMSAGGGVVSVTLENVVLAEGGDGPALPPGDYVRLRVADQGGGIQPGVLPKIFDPYFSTKQRGAQKGMGLGLTICHAIVQQHRGTIRVSSEIDKGTAFSVYLPAVRHPVVPLAATRTANQPHEAAPRILVIEDEATMRQAVGLAIKQFGFDVLLAEDGDTAVEVFAKEHAAGRPPALVLLVLAVRSGMDGAETLSQLRRIDPLVKAVALVSSADSHPAPSAIPPGFQAVLGIPFDVDGLGKVLTRVLGR